MATRARRRVKGAIPSAFQWGARGLWFLATHPAWLITLLVAAGIGAATWATVRESPAFRITTVLLPADSALRAPANLIGRNLWEVDLGEASRALLDQQPQLKRVQVVRIPPSTIRIDVYERRPVAQVQLGQWYPMDAEGFVLPEPSAAPIEGLVILKGASERLAPLKVGRAHDGARVQTAVRVAHQLRRSPWLRGQRVVAIDVGDPKQLRFTLDGDVEVRCGSEQDLAVHLERLRSALERVWEQHLPVRYIDVRFPDPVIGPRV